MRRRCGTHSCRISSRFPSSSVARMLTPVVLPPGRAMLAASPPPITSSLIVMIGSVEVAAWRAFVAGSPVVTSTFGRSATSSCANIRRRSLSSCAQRWTSRMLRPSSHPISFRVRRSTVVSEPGFSNSRSFRPALSRPMVGVGPPGCAWATRANATEAQPSPEMNSRRLVCRERSIVRDDGGRFTTPPPSRLEARSRLGDKAANELGAPVVSSIPAQLPGLEPASARKGREDDRAVLRWNRCVAGPA